MYYILNGELTMFNPEKGQTVVLGKGESILMPKGVPHKAYNFTDESAKILYVIAPKIWDEFGPPLDYNEPFKLYKHESREV